MASTTISEAGSDFKVSVNVGNPSGNINGIKGEQGIQGIQGTQGVQGIKGDVGTTGSQGIQGPIGLKGDTGLQGIKGDIGSNGIQGIQGLKGDKGDKGDGGLDAYTLAVNSGFIGTRAAWLESLRGVQGFTGAQGERGLKGDTGAKGSTGATGLQGVQGLRGATGNAGVRGLTGEKGSTGLTGSQGEKGIQGDQGVQGIQGDQGVQGIQGVIGPKVDVAAVLGTSEIYAVSQKLLTDEVGKMVTSIGVIKSQSDASVVTVNSVDTRVTTNTTKTSELQNSINALLAYTSSLEDKLYSLIPFTPYHLYRNNKIGAFYDPSDLTTLWQDAAGTVPVTKSGDPVGLLKDKSGNGNHAKQTESASRPTYQTDGILHKLVFDGVDDCMIATLNVALSASGKLTLGVGVNAINTSAAFIIEQGASSSSLNSFNLMKSSGEYTYTGRGNRGALSGDVTKVNTPLSRVVAIAEHDLNSGIPSSLTVNNLAKANSTATNYGVGGFGSASLNIGSRNGGSLFYKGDMYGIVVVGDVTSAANKDSLKQYLAQKSGVTL